MFDIAWSEFLVVAVVALVVVGPRDLPALLRTVGKTVASLRRMAGEFQSQFNEAMREAELDDLKKEVTGLKDAASKAVGASPFQIARDELRNALSDVSKPPPSALAGGAPRAEPETEVPSALAPEIQPIPEPPAPSTADFAPPAGARRKAAARAAAKSAPKPAASGRTETPVPSKAAASKSPSKAAPKGKSPSKAANGAAHPSADPAEAEAKLAPKPRRKPKSPGASA